VLVKHKVILSAAGVAGALAVLLAVPAAAEPPTGGAFIPGESLAGVRLGMTKAQVIRVWGERHGVCRDCRETTWYFNERPFVPQGTGVVFAGGRVVHAFTVWQPEGWATPEGLTLAEGAGEIGATYGELAEEECGGYSALVREDPSSRTAFYVFGDDVWGFGLLTPGRSPCL
jgi:hypothetical protein